MNQPCESHALSSEDMARPALEQIVSDVSALVTPPIVCVKMYDLVRSERATAADIGDVVALDPNLTGRLLQIVNSAYFGFKSRIGSIERAVTVIGVRDLHNLVLAITAVRSFSALGAGLVTMEAFWRHSVFGALVTRELARQLSVPDPERFFVAGLLHDIGMLVMYSQLGDHIEPMRTALDDSEASLHTAEMAGFGFSHACVGAAVLAQWGLPDDLLTGVRLHHAPSAAPANEPTAALIHVADALASQAEQASLQLNPTSEDATAWASLGIDSETFDTTTILDTAQEAFGQAMKSLMP